MRAVGITTLAVAMALLVGACGGGQPAAPASTQKPSADSAKPAATAQTSTGAQGAAPKDAIVLKYHHHDPPTSIGHVEAHTKWAQLVSEKTGGKVKVEIYPGETLGKAKDAFDLVANGIADISWGFIGVMPGRFPLTEAIDLPMLGIETATAGSKAVQTLYETTPAIQKEYAGAKLLFLHTHGPTPVGLRSKKVERMEDLKGMKFRSPAGPPTNLMKALGASPVTIAPPEIYDSVQKGVVDGYVIDWHGVAAFRLYEVSKYTIDANMYVAPFFLIMNQKKWDSLGPENQKAIESISGMFGAEMYGKAWDKAQDVSADNSKKSGNEIYKLSPSEMDRWTQLAQPQWDQWIKDMGSKGLPGKEVFDKTRELVTKYK